MSQIKKRLQRGVELLQGGYDRPGLNEERRRWVDYGISAAAALSPIVDGILQRSETFDFGTIGFKQVEEETTSAMSFYEAGFLVPPFDDFVFSLTLDNGVIREVETGGRFDRITLLGTTDRDIINSLFGASNVTANPDDCLFVIIGLVAIGPGLIPMGVVAALLPERCGPGFGFARLMGTSNVDGYATAFFAACWSILNTKGIELKRRGPTKEQHAALLAKGITSARPITYVGVKKYLEAREEASRMASSGTHASPRPHLRRGHIRQRYGRNIAVRPCIVNSTVGDTIKRDKYVVRHQGDQQ
jgi:hypothetical protein